MLDYDEAAATSPEWYTFVDDALAICRYEEAGRLVREAAPTSEQDPAAKTLSAIANAKVSMAKSDLRAAKRKIDDALKSAKLLGDRRLEAAALHRSAKIALESAAEIAIAQAEEALAIYRSLEDRFGEASVLVTLGKAHLPIDSEQARGFANDASHIFSLSSVRKGQAAALHVLFSLMLMQGRFNNAMILVGEMERYYRIASDLPNASTCQLLSSQVLLSSGKLSDALAAANSVARIAEGLGDEKKQAAAAYMLANIMDASNGRLGDVESAAYNAWSFMRSVRDKAGMAAALEVLASHLAKKNKFSSAVQKLDEASSLYRQLKDARMEAAMVKKKEKVIYKEMVSKGEIVERVEVDPKKKAATKRELTDISILRSAGGNKAYCPYQWEEHEAREAQHMQQKGSNEPAAEVAKLEVKLPSEQEVLYDVQWKGLTQGALTAFDQPIVA